MLEVVAETKNGSTYRQDTTEVGLKTKNVFWRTGDLYRAGLLPLGTNLAVTIDNTAREINATGQHRKLLVNIGFTEKPEAMTVECCLVARRQNMVSPQRERGRLVVHEKTGKITAYMDSGETEYSGCISDVTKWLSDGIMKRLLKAVPA